MVSAKAAIRWVWILSIGWWLGPIMFVSGLLLCFTIIGLPLGYKMMDSAYNFATFNFN